MSKRQHGRKVKTNGRAIHGGVDLSAMAQEAKDRNEAARIEAELKARAAKMPDVSVMGDLGLGWELAEFVQHQAAGHSMPGCEKMNPFRLKAVMDEMNLRRSQDAVVDAVAGDDAEVSGDE